MVVITDLSPCDLHGVVWYYIQCDKYNSGDLEQLKAIHRLYIMSLCTVLLSTGVSRYDPTEVAKMFKSPSQHFCYGYAKCRQQRVLFVHSETCVYVCVCGSVCVCVWCVCVCVCVCM